MSARGGRREGAGRKLGAPNKLNADVKELILGALEDVGGRQYLAARALDTPASFMALLGKILPTQLTGEDGAPIAYSFRWADAALPEDNAEPVVTVQWIEADAPAE
jgi:hypothetical protein